MYRLFLTFMLVIALGSPLFAQTTRTVLLEEFTGTWCGYCPYGADIIDNILATKPYVRAVAYHKGQTSYPDPMETPEGVQFITGLNQTSYPAAAIDRVLWAGQAKIPITRSLWDSKCAERSAVTSPMSIIVDGYYDEPNRILGTHIQLQALQSMSGEYRLNVVIVEDSINATQIYYPPGGGTVYLNPYYHKRAVRKMVTGPSGSLLTTTGFSQGWTKDTIIAYALPQSWVAKRCRVTVFISKMSGSTYSEVQQSVQEPIYSLMTITPVRLVSFLASQVPDGALLTWRTAEESNNLGWEIEKQTADGAWSRIGFVPGAGTTREQQVYEYLDKQVRIGGTYQYRLRQMDIDGNQELSPVASVTLFGVPTTTRLVRNFPNPFNPSTHIMFDLEKDAVVTLEVYDVMGRLVAMLAHESLEAGTHVRSWNGLDQHGNTLPSGMYLARLRTPFSHHTIQMQMMK